MKVTLEFLGTGTSVGVPVIGCDCAVCQSTDSRDKRLRSSALVKAFAQDAAPVTTVLLDTTPDFRQQMLRANVRRIDAVVITHFHADHVTGIDDIRRFNFMQQEIIDLWGSAETLASMRQSFGYIFTDSLRWGWPSIRAREIKFNEPFEIGALRLLPFELDHEVITNTGLRIAPKDAQSGGVSYCLDVKRIAPESMEHLRGTDTLVLDMLREKNHPTHMNLAEALAVVDVVKPRQTFLGHIAHEVSHAELSARLPANVRLAHDGLVVNVD